ncbi:MAG: M48 family metallopeptidase [Acidobacteria bacterium]|nr:M48 family metallopeptidase [Acidobacteriota bacterium]MBS1864710.1 M48 family metallopeptidase [Acidobacteriota bacterium]
MTRSGVGRFLMMVFLCCVLLLPAAMARAAEAPDSPKCPEILIAQEKPTVDPPTPRSPEPAWNPPVTEAKSETEQYTLSHERYEKAVAYSRAAYALYFIWSIGGIAIVWLLLRLRIAAKMRDFAEQTTENRFLQGLIFIPMLILAAQILELPVLLYWHSLSLRYQQSVQGWGSWFWDWTKEEGLLVGGALIFGSILLWRIRKTPKRWWLQAWCIALAIAFAMFFVSPWVIDPLFNKYEPLSATHPELVSSIEKVTQRAGLSIPRDHMFLMRASKKTNQINAYVTGVGASKRVVVWDTTIQKMAPNETLFIFGHEAGHYVLGHVRNGFLFFSVTFLVAMYACFRAMHFLLGKWGGTWRIYGPQDLACLAVLLLIFRVFSFVGTPIESAFSRMEEHSADVFGLEVIHGIVPNSGEVAAHAFQVLGQEDLSDPNPPPFITFWLYSHPPLAERLVFAHSYDPWSKGQTPRYVK